MQFCSACDNLFLVFGVNACNITKEIIHFPDKEGRFCKNWRERRNDKGGNNDRKRKSETAN